MKKDIATLFASMVIKLFFVPARRVQRMTVISVTSDHLHKQKYDK